MFQTALEEAKAGTQARQRGMLPSLRACSGLLSSWSSGCGLSVDVEGSARGLEFCACQPCSGWAVLGLWGTSLPTSHLPSSAGICRCKGFWKGTAQQLMCLAAGSWLGGVTILALNCVFVSSFPACHGFSRQCLRARAEPSWVPVLKQ